MRVTEAWASETTEIVRSLLVTTQASSVSRLRSKSAGRRGQANVPAGAHRVEGDLHQAGRVAIQHPERVAGAREAHGDGGVAGAHAPRNGQQAGLDLVDRAIGGCQHIGLGGLRAREHLRRSGVERDLLAGAKAREIDHPDGASVPIGDEAVSEEALGLGSGTGRGGRRGQQQRASRNQGTVHSDILSPGGVERAAHVIL